MKIRKPILDLSVFVILLTSVIFTVLRGSEPDPFASYPKTDEAKYWFELENDLFFSEQFTLPEFTDNEYGKLEYPSIAIDSRKNFYVAYDFTSDAKEAIYLNSFNTGEIQFEEKTMDEPYRRFLKMKTQPKWQQPTQISTEAGEEYRPRIGITPDDIIWIVWSAKRNGNWDIFARTYFEGKLSEEFQITNNNEYDFRPGILTTKDGRIWIAWERGTADKNIHIVAKYFENKKWSDEIIIEARDGYAYRPVMVEGKNGEIWFAWDYNQGYNTDVYLTSFKDDKLRSKPVQVSTHPAIDSKSALAWYDDKLWVAWTTNRRGDNDWGVVRYPIIRAFDGKNWFEPDGKIGGIDFESRSETQSFEFPTIAFDPAGQLYLFNRHDHVFSARTYSDGKWSDHWFLDTQSWGLRGLYVHTARATDNELWLATRQSKTIYFQKMVGGDLKKSKIPLKKYKQKIYPENLKTVENNTTRRKTNAGNYEVYFGELHVHTAYSDGSGSFDDLYNLYKNIYKLDFLAITEHDALRRGRNHFSPGEWAYIKSLNEIYNKPGEFITINAYEWTHSTWSGPQDSSSSVGHKNVYFKGGEDSPFFNHHGDVAYDGVSLFKTLHDHDGLAFPHHPPWSGMNWDEQDPEIESNYEIVSIHGANEYPGNLPIPHRGGLPGTFAQDGLTRGNIIGFIGASDSHGLYFHASEGWRADPYKGGWTGILLEPPVTREKVWQALQQRRNYATAGEKIFLELAVNDQPMGSIIKVTQPPVITFQVRSTDLLYAYIIRNNEVLFISGKIGGNFTAYKGMKDETIQPGKNFYYLRAQFKDGTMAWSSPIWVTFEPEN